MALLGSPDGAANDPLSSLRLPASKRISSPASERLSTITEGDRASREPVKMPLRSALKKSVTSGDRGIMAGNSQVHPAFRSMETLRSGPPAYGYVPTSSIGDDEDLTAPVEGEKLARLRRGEQKRERGGFWRLLIVALIVLAVIGLAVGLGVGLTVGRRNSSTGGGGGDNSGGTSSTASADNAQTSAQFPLGEYSFVTALRTQQTDCSANAATWRCYPYSTFADSNASSQATFNWVITNTSSSFALNTTGTTSTTGIPANLTISTQNNPFSISFTNQSLTYINDGTNSSSPRYSFTFTMTKVVVPSPAITSDNQASQCFFNSTVFAGVLYLSAQRTYPDAQLQSSTSVGGYTQWPYAVEITQTSPGGNNIPDCYEMVNGVSTDRIGDGLEAQPESSTCLCDYRNY